jgi:hypothetical protein
MAGVTYELAGERIVDAVSAVMREHHPGLRDAEVTIDVLLAHGPRDGDGDLVGPAIKVRGHRAVGLAKVMSLKDRVAGRADAEIVLDGDEIDEWSEPQLAAIIDHELTHLELKVDDDGAVKRDDTDRPQLRIREHDHEFGWFDEVALRHGKQSYEVRQAEQLLTRDDLRQLYLPGMSPTGA